MTDYKNELPQDSIEQIEQDLAASFEQFRQAEGAYLSATPAASTGAAHVFVQRFLRHVEALLSQHSKKRELEAVKLHHTQLGDDAYQLLKHSNLDLRPQLFQSGYTCAINELRGKSLDRISKLTNGEGDKNV